MKGRAALIAAILTAVTVLTVAQPPTAAADPQPPLLPPSVIALKSDPDQTGVRTSAYTGRYYQPTNDAMRRCIAWREGRGQYWGTGSHGYYQGTYQFTAALARGAAWEMTPELKAVWPDRWRLIRDTLLDTPMHRWGRYWQDMAFWTILNVDGPLEGLPHWAGGYLHCHPGMTWTTP